MISCILEVLSMIHFIFSAASSGMSTFIATLAGLMLCAPRTLPFSDAMGAVSTMPSSSIVLVVLANFCILTGSALGAGAAAPAAAGVLLMPSSSNVLVVRANVCTFSGWSGCGSAATGAGLLMIPSSSKVLLVRANFCAWRL